MAQDKSAWSEFGKYFTEYVEAHVLREDTRASLARDARALVQAQRVGAKDSYEQRFTPMGHVLSVTSKLLGELIKSITLMKER